MSIISHLEKDLMRLWSLNLSPFPISLKPIFRRKACTSILVLFLSLIPHRRPRNALTTPKKNMCTSQTPRHSCGHSDTSATTQKACYFITILHQINARDGLYAAMSDAELERMRANCEMECEWIQVCEPTGVVVVEGACGDCAAAEMPAVVEGKRGCWWKL